MRWITSSISYTWAFQRGLWSSTSAAAARLSPQARRRRSMVAGLSRRNSVVAGMPCSALQQLTSASPHPRHQPCVRDCILQRKVRRRAEKERRLAGMSCGACTSGTDLADRLGGVDGTRVGRIAQKCHIELDRHVAEARNLVHAGPQRQHLALGRVQHLLHAEQPHALRERACHGEQQSGKPLRPPSIWPMSMAGFKLAPRSITMSERRMVDWPVSASSSTSVHAAPYV